MVKLQKNVLKIGKKKKYIEGMKVTPQRLAVLKYLKNNRVHPSAENVHKALLKDYPSISLTTVYKTLAKFVEQGMIQQINIDPIKMRFDICTDDHDHFYCWICDNVYDIFYDKQNCVDNLKKNNREGHRVDSVSINLKGVCKYCEGEGTSASM